MIRIVYRIFCCRSLTNKRFNSNQSQWKNEGKEFSDKFEFNFLFDSMINICVFIGGNKTLNLYSFWCRCNERRECGRFPVWTKTLEFTIEIYERSKSFKISSFSFHFFIVDRYSLRLFNSIIVHESSDHKRRTVFKRSCRTANSIEIPVMTINRRHTENIKHDEQRRRDRFKCMKSIYHRMLVIQNLHPQREEKNWRNYRKIKKNF